MSTSAIVGGVAFVWALVGPPKLPPIGGRAVPAPVEPAVEAPPASSPRDVPPPPDAPAESPATKAPAKAPPGTVPPPPAAPAAKPTAPGAPTGPEVLANGPSGSQIAAPKLPSGPTTPTRPGVAATPRNVTGPGATPLRLVSNDEVARWDREDASARLAPASTSAPEPTANDTQVVRTAAPEPADPRPRFRRSPHPPDRSAAFVLGYRYFRIQDGLGRPQDWHLASIEVTPMRRYVRLNLITEFGVEGGEAARNDRADILLMQRIGLGMQYPHVVTPFLEFQGGAGGARVELFGRNDVALLYTLGLDVGAQWAVGKWLFLHAAVGWIRPTFVWPGRTLSYDRASFKLGIGF